MVVPAEPLKVDRGDEVFRCRRLLKEKLLAGNACHIYIGGHDIGGRRNGSRKDYVFEHIREPP